MFDVLFIGDQPWLPMNLKYGTCVWQGGVRFDVTMLISGLDFASLSFQFTSSTCQEVIYFSFWIWRLMLLSRDGNLHGLGMSYATTASMS